jgi:glyoxylase-like metal-dependent hydrolase (beta-lactamase superfamily II)
MSQTPITRPIGRAIVTVINIGDLRVDMAEWMQLGPSEWPAEFADAFEEPIYGPIQCVHIKTPELSVMVDAGRFDEAEMGPSTLPGYRPPPDVPEQLAGVGVNPEEVTHFVLTHAHYDHFNGTTLDRPGHPPLFPNARHYIGRADWENEVMQADIYDPAEPESTTLAKLYDLGMLELVDENLELGPGLTIMASPGESPGHQSVRLRSGGHTFYCVGDLYHHPVEVAYPELAAYWNDKEQVRASRRRLEEAALAEEALLLATHIPGFGRLVSRPKGVRWQTV